MAFKWKVIVFLMVAQLWVLGYTVWNNLAILKTSNVSQFKEYVYKEAEMAERLLKPSLLSGDQQEKTHVADFLLRETGLVYIQVQQGKHAMLALGALPTHLPKTTSEHVSGAVYHIHKVTSLSNGDAMTLSLGFSTEHVLSAVSQGDSKVFFVALLEVMMIVIFSLLFAVILTRRFGAVFDNSALDADDKFHANGNGIRVSGKIESMLSCIRSIIQTVYRRYILKTSAVIDQRLFGCFFDKMHDCIAIVDEEGKILHENGAWSAFFYGENSSKKACYLSDVLMIDSSVSMDELTLLFEKNALYQTCGHQLLQGAVQKLQMSLNSACYAVTVTRDTHSGRKTSCDISRDGGFFNHEVQAYDLSHELKKEIIGAIDDGKLGVNHQSMMGIECVNEICKRIEEAAVQRIDNIFDFTKIKNGMMSFHSSIFFLKDVLESTARMARYPDVQWVVVGEKNAAVVGDSERLNQVIDHMIEYVDLLHGERNFTCHVDIRKINNMKFSVDFRMEKTVYSHYVNENLEIKKNLSEYIVNVMGGVLSVCYKKESVICIEFNCLFQKENRLSACLEGEGDAL